jgi:hypothetical protein
MRRKYQIIKGRISYKLIKTTSASRTPRVIMKEIFEIWYTTVGNKKTNNYHLLRYIHLGGNSNTDLTLKNRKLSHE